MKEDEQSRMGVAIYQKVKGGLIAKGDSVTAWCKRQGTSTSNLRQAFYGSWDGERARALRDQAIRDAGLEK